LLTLASESDMNSTPPSDRLQNKGAQEGAEHRAYPRAVLNAAITAVGGNNFFLGLSGNISEGGIFIATAQVFEVGTAITVEFTVPTSPLPIRVSGEVRWVRTTNATSMFGGADDDYDLAPGIGIQFQQLGRPDEDAIRKFIEMREPEFFDV
jgi:uncharacterized protein (TIGR02266 family)